MYATIIGVVVTVAFLACKCYEFYDYIFHEDYPLKHDSDDEYGEEEPKEEENKEE